MAKKKKGQSVVKDPADPWSAWPSLPIPKSAWPSLPIPKQTSESTAAKAPSTSSYFSAYAEQDTLNDAGESNTVLEFDDIPISARSHRTHADSLKLPSYSGPTSPSQLNGSHLPGLPVKSFDSKSIWDEQRIAKYRSSKVRLPYIESRVRFERYRLLHIGDSSYDFRDRWYKNDPMLIPSNIIYYDIDNEDSVMEIDRQMTFLVYGDSSYQDYDIDQASLYKNSEIKGIPTIFYAVYSRDIRKVEKWLKEGADPNSIAKLKDLFDSEENSNDPLVVEIPVLAFAILLEETKIVRMLLSFGAKPSAIPDVLRLPYVKPAIYKLKTPRKVADEFIQKVHQKESTKWCNDVVFNHLRKTINLSIRYDLHRGDSFKVSARHKQFAKSPRWDCMPLFRAHFDLVGQEFALKKILQEVLRLTEKVEDSSKKPAVLLFAGPSGHGKTEMALQMERYLGLPFHAVNGAHVQRQSDLFGQHAGYEGWREGSSLNNFLAANDGSRCIVFIDEVEKTSREVRNALLVPFERGATITNRQRANVSLDISKVIWIMATNALDSTIKSFYEQNQPLTLEKLMGKQGLGLMSQLKRALCSDYGGLGTAFTSRIDLILPFFPFSKDEQAVLAHRNLWDVRCELLKPICLENDHTRKLVGNIKLTMEKDYKHSRIVAKSYHADEGARSIKQGVANIEKDIFYHFLESSDEEVAEKDKDMITEYILKAEKSEDVILVHTGNVTSKEDFCYEVHREVTIRSNSLVDQEGLHRNQQGGGTWC